jgi:trimeric autotransporter adhesin
MNHMFKATANFTGKGLETWDTSRVTNMWNMFQVASKFNGNISGWNTRRVTNMVRSALPWRSVLRLA